MADVSDRSAVVVDVHEAASGVGDALERLGVRVIRRALEAGDYVVGPDSLVERKAVSDLHDSIVKGRFWPQLFRLRAFADEVWLVVEGRRIDAGPVHPDAIRGALITASERGVRVLRSESSADTARWLRRLAIRRQNPRRPRDRPGYAQRPAPRDAQVPEAMLAAVSGISTVTARLLLDRFGSVAGVVAATSGELHGVPGMGPARADALREAINFSWPRQKKEGPST